MATIEKRTDATGTVTYRVKVRLKGHPTQTATFPRLTDARKWGTQTEAAIREGRHFKTTEAKRHTLADLIDRYSREVLPTKRATTQPPQRIQLAWWRAKLGSYALADLTPALIAEYRDILKDEPIPSQAKDPAKAGPTRYRTPASINRFLAVLSHAFTIAVKEYGWIENNPVLKVTKHKEPRGRVRFLSDDERERLLAACKASCNDALYPAVVIALSTGARRMEVMGLRWPDVDLARRVATLHHTKNGERRVLPLAGPALELLKERAKVRRLDTDLLFPGTPHRNPDGTPKPIAPVDVSAAFERACLAAGIEDFRFHDLRHTAASYLAMNGASLAEIAEVLGHKTLQMVKRYAHLSDAHTAGVVERMNRAVFGEGFN
jgi:integrase